MKQVIKNYWPYLLVTLAVMLPLLAPGYVLVLDMVFVPQPALPAETGSSFMFHAALHFLGFIIPADILQKVILLLILLLSGVGMHRLMLHIKPPKVSYWPAAAYIAGLFYMLNPFVYGRFMAGQYAVLLGYALLPFFAVSLWKLLKKPTARQALFVSLWAVTICIMSIHTVGLIALLALVAIIAAAGKNRNKAYLTTLTKSALIAVFAWIILSSYWLVPTLLGEGSIAQQTAQFNDADQKAFATDGGLLAVLQLQGFWAEAQGMFRLSGSVLPLSGVWQSVLWAGMICGGITLWKRQKTLATVLFCTAVIAIIIALVPFAINGLSHVFPLVAGYREPHKFVALVALAGAVLLGYGMAFILAHLQQQWAKAAVLSIAFISVVCTTPTMLWSFNGQLQTSQYPKDWYALQTYFKSQPPHGRVLSLPWHLYMKYHFTNRTIANPTESFFTSADIVRSDDPEFANVTPGRTSQVTDDLGRLLQKKDAKALVNYLKANQFSYILLTKDGDYKNYNYLSRAEGLKIIQDSRSLTLYSIERDPKDAL